MDPQDVIVLGFLYRPQQLPVKLKIGEVPHLVMVGELHPGDRVDQGVDLVLGVVLLGQQRILER